MSGSGGYSGGGGGDFPGLGGTDRWQPAVDVSETEKNIIIRVELAGVRGSDVRVNVDGRRVRIRGVRTPPENSDAVRVHHMEIAFGPFERIIEIDVPFEAHQVTAQIEDGFLVILLQKREALRRSIPIKAVKS